MNVLKLSSCLLVTLCFTGCSGNNSPKAGHDPVAAGGAAASNTGTAKCTEDFIRAYNAVTQPPEVRGGRISNDDMPKVKSRCEQFFTLYGLAFECLANVKNPNDADFKNQKISSADAKVICDQMNK